MDKHNTLINVMIEIVLQHYEKNDANFELGNLKTYEDTNFEYLKEFMDELCRHLGDRDHNHTFTYDDTNSEYLEIVRGPRWYNILNMTTKSEKVI